MDINHIISVASLHDIMKSSKKLLHCMIIIHYYTDGLN